MKNIKNRCKLYAIIIVGTFLIAQIISAITGVSTVNTWLGLVGVSIIFLIIIIMLFDISRTIKGTYPRISRHLKHFAIAAIVSTVFAYILMLFATS